MPFGMSRYYIRGGRAPRPDPLHYIKLPGVETYLWTDKDGNTHLRLHQTDVVSFNDQWITLRTGGWKTMMTKGRINWASDNFDLGFTVYSRPSERRSDESRGVWTEGIAGEERQVKPYSPPSRRRIGTRHEGDWFVEYDGQWPFDDETVSFNRQTHQMEEMDERVETTSDFSECKRQRWKPRFNNPGRPSAKNIAMSGESSDDIDVEVDDQGSIILFKLVSEAAQSWWRENISNAQTFGGRYVVEHRYAVPIIEGMMVDGLNVR